MSFVSSQTHRKVNERIPKTMEMEPPKTYAIIVYFYGTVVSKQ
jgi:hypothetical protein